jgi:hypothetical protein
MLEHPLRTRLLDILAGNSKGNVLSNRSSYQVDTLGHMGNRQPPWNSVAVDARGRADSPHPLAAGLIRPEILSPRRSGSQG